MSKEYVARARSLVGTRFRPQGRDVRIGLDCVGLALAVFRIPVDKVRKDYRLRGDHGRDLKAQVGRFFRQIGKAAAKPGDLFVSQVAQDQLHLSICTDGGFVHADARIGRVVETPGTPQWPSAGAYRRRVRNAGA